MLSEFPTLGCHPPIRRQHLGERPLLNIFHFGQSTHYPSATMISTIFDPW